MPSSFGVLFVFQSSLVIDAGNGGFPAKDNRGVSNAAGNIDNVERQGGEGNGLSAADIGSAADGLHVNRVSSVLGEVGESLGRSGNSLPSAAVDRYLPRGSGAIGGPANGSLVVADVASSESSDLAAGSGSIGVDGELDVRTIRATRTSLSTVNVSISWGAVGLTIHHTVGNRGIVVLQRARTRSSRFADHNNEVALIGIIIERLIEGESLPPGVRTNSHIAVAIDQRNVAIPIARALDG